MCAARAFAEPDDCAVNPETIGKHICKNRITGSCNLTTVNGYVSPTRRRFLIINIVAIQNHCESFSIP